MTELVPETTGPLPTRASNRSMVSGLLVSFVVHILLLAGLSLMVFKAPLAQLQMIVDSVLTDERAQEEFHDEVEQSTIAVDTVNY
ncbi:MAG: hypothetical protein WCH39_12425, partial [Schlesneria sp.]